MLSPRLDAQIVPLHTALQVAIADKAIVFGPCSVVEFVLAYNEGGSITVENDDFIAWLEMMTCMPKVSTACYEHVALAEFLEVVVTAPLRSHSELLGLSPRRSAFNRCYCLSERFVQGIIEVRREYHMTDVLFQLCLVAAFLLVMFACRLEKLSKAARNRFVLPSDAPSIDSVTIKSTIVSIFTPRIERRS